MSDGKLFCFDPAKYAAHFAREGYVHIPQGVTEVTTDADAVISGDPLGCSVTSTPVEATDPLAETQEVRNVDALLS